MFVGECNDAIECVLFKGDIEGMAALYSALSMLSVCSSCIYPVILVKSAFDFLVLRLMRSRDVCAAAI